MMIIETSDNRLFLVQPFGDEKLAHVWCGLAVKRVTGGSQPRAGAKAMMVRREASRLVDPKPVMVRP